MARDSAICDDTPHYGTREQTSNEIGWPGPADHDIERFRPALTK